MINKELTKAMQDLSASYIKVLTIGTITVQGTQADIAAMLQKFWGIKE